MRALVLSGGGMFGAWQAGAWAALAPRWRPELIVGASVGSLNRDAIASGADAEALSGLWRREPRSKLSRLSGDLREFTDQYRPRLDFAVVATELLRLKARIFRGGEVDWRHLAASCAIPLVIAPVRIDGRLYADGGLLNPLPVWAAVELGATEIIALHALPEIPSWWLKPPARAFRRIFGVNPVLPSGISCRTILPGRRLGSMRDALNWKRANIERWLEEGYGDALRAGFPGPFQNTTSKSSR
jgi:NTE family protein